jgi:DNA-binding transcriptional MerR regulator
MDRSPVYSIGAVARLVGIPTTTLRAWEERYGVILPERSPGGQRLYSRDQIAQLQFVTERMRQGLSAADAHRLLADGGQPMPPEAQGEGPLLILLAERDEYAAELAEFFLRTEGFEVILALNAEEAARIVEDRQPRLVVLELLISGGTGIDLCRRIRDRSAVPVVCVSALGLGDEALAAGADAFLPKPLDPLAFVSTVKDLLGESSLIGGSVRTPV